MLAVVHFRHGGISMAPAILSVIAFLALVVWRFVFAGMHRWPLVRPIAPWQHRRNDILQEGLHISDPGDVAVVAGNVFEHSSGSLDPIDRRDPAIVFLRRVAALAGATEMGEEYVLNVAATRCHGRDGYIRGFPTAAVPHHASQQNTFYHLPIAMP